MRVRPWRQTVAATIAISSVACSVRAQSTAPSDWSQFRGPNATGIAVTSKAPPIEFGPGKNILWKTVVPAGRHSSPVFWRDRIFLTAFDGERKQLLVMGLDRATGRELWRKDVPFARLSAAYIRSVHRPRPRRSSTASGSTPTSSRRDFLPSRSREHRRGSSRCRRHKSASAAARRLSSPAIWSS